MPKMLLAIVCVPVVLGGLSFLFSVTIILVLSCRVVNRRLGLTSARNREQQTNSSSTNVKKDSAAGALSVTSGSIKPPKGYAESLCSWYLTSGELRISQAGLSRILVGLLSYTVLLSLASALSTFMVPKDFEGAYSEYAKGTEATCRFQR